MNPREMISRNSLLLEAWTLYRRRQLHGSYRTRREHFAELAAREGLVYRQDEVTAQIRRRIFERGYIPAVRKPGEIHTFACIPQIGWHRHLLPDLRELGPVSLFDYASLGLPCDAIGSPGERAVNQRKYIVSEVIPALRKAVERQPVDWVFCYGGGKNTSAAVIREIVDTWGIPVVNMTLDDKHGWEGPDMGEHRAGAIDITAAFDLFITSARVACEWHMLSGGRPIYMPEGFSSAEYHPMPVEQDLPVSFVGAAYGFRRSAVTYLRRGGVDVRTFGRGWPGGGWVKDLVEVFNRSAINLGMGGIGYSESLTNVKGRDFEVPGTGGGVYLTTFNPDLAQHFEIGSEILCYANRDEMLELIRWYLQHPDEAREIARKGRERCLREHRWLHRYRLALEILGILEPETQKE